MLGTNVELFMRKEGSGIVQQIRDGLDKQKRAGSDSNSSHKLRNSLKSVVLNMGTVVENHIRGLSYWFFVDKGRKKGKFPPKQKIEDYVDQKPIRSDIDKRSLVFLIRRKIAREGTPATFIFTKVFKDVFKSYPDRLANFLGEKQIKEFKISLTQ